MFVIDEAKLPPPAPASEATSRYVVSEWPGLTMSHHVVMVGTRSATPLTIVQFRPPKKAVAIVYGTRSSAPTRVGTATSTNLSAAVKPYTACGMNSTMTDQIDQIE